MSLQKRLMAGLAAAVFAVLASVQSTNPAHAITGSHDHSFSKCGSVRGHVTFAGGGVSNRTQYYATQYYGNNNGCVGQIQYVLNDSFCTSGTRLAVDNGYGPKTRTAVLRFQRFAAEHGYRIDGKAIKQDGIVGPQTWGLLTTSSWAVWFHQSCK